MQSFVIPFGLCQSTERLVPAALHGEFLKGRQMLIHVNFLQSYIQHPTIIPRGQRETDHCYRPDFLRRFQQIGTAFPSVEGL